MTKHICIIAVLLVSFLAGHAQSDFREGYYITTSNDTIRGWIDFRSDRVNSTGCRYKVSLDTKDVEEFRPGEITSYRFKKEGKYYVSKNITVNKEPRLVFAEYLVDGIMNLYYYKSSKDEYYFFENESGEVVEITQKPSRFDGNKLITDSTYINKLNYTFREYPELSEKIRNNEKKKETVNFNRADFIMITQEYHKLACTTGEDCIVFANNYMKTYPKITIRPYVGVQYLEYRWDLINSVADKAIYPSAGVQLTLSLPRISQEIAFLIDGSISGMKGNNYSTYNNSFVGIEYSATLIQAKAGVEYKYMRSKFQPFVQAGFASAFLSSSTDAYVSLVENGKVITSISSDENHKPKSSFTGWFASAGLSYELPNRKSVFIQFSYEDMKNKDQLKAMQLKAGYIF